MTTQTEPTDSALRSAMTAGHQVRTEWRSARRRRALLGRLPTEHEPDPADDAAGRLDARPGRGGHRGLEVRHERSTQILALRPGELDPSLRKAARRCLEVMAPQPDAGAPQPEFVPVSLADVTIASRQGTWVGVLFLNDTGYMGCETQLTFGRVFSIGVGGEAWPHRGWLPGPVQRLSLSSTESTGGSVSVLGRVSPRVHRLVLEHGTGRTTTARISGGAFGIISRTGAVREHAELVSYDAAGREIDRRRLFQPPDVYDHCYTGPDGEVIYGSRGPADCLPADPWRR